MDERIAWRAFLDAHAPTHEAHGAALRVAGLHGSLPIIEARDCVLALAWSHRQMYVEAEIDPAGAIDWTWFNTATGAIEGDLIDVGGDMSSLAPWVAATCATESD